MLTSIRPSRSMNQPGAVPIGFSSASAEGISHACFWFLAGIGLLRIRKKRSTCASSAGSTAGVSPSIAAIASRVRSSSVGPTPPVTIVRSERPQARASVSVRRPRLSPTCET